jgi:hypothetical protein
MSDSNVLGIDYSKGATFIGNTDTHTGRWCAIHFTTNAIVDTLVPMNWNGETISGQSFSASSTIYGVFTSIKLQNGHCVAYRL